MTVILPLFHDELPDNHICNPHIREDTAPFFKMWCHISVQISAKHMRLKLLTVGLCLRTYY